VQAARCSVDVVDLIVIPTYNEAENVVDLVDQLLGELPRGTVHVLVVDDSSPDGTGELITTHPLFGDTLHLESREVKDGLGNAYRHGFRWAHERGYDRVVQMDADGSHDPSSVRPLLAALDDADIAVGSRYVAGGATSDWPWYRELVSRGGNLYVRALLGLPVRDATSGFRAYRSAALAFLVSSGGQANGYSFQVESTWRAVGAGFTVREVPITFSDRQRGRSKMGIGIVVEAMWRVLRWRFSDTTERVAVQTR
jgi:dolichol-phosphate mannosyltransferase